MPKIRIQNRTKHRVPIKKIRKIVEEIVEEEIGDVSVDVFFVGEKTIARLNEAFGKVKGSTDVLTFVYNDQDLHGEIFLCPAVISRNARKFGCDYEEELLRVTIHATLHLAGYDHEFDTSRSEIMFQKQEEYLKEVEGGGC